MYNWIRRYTMNMDPELKSALNIIMNNQKELLKQQQVNNMLLLANNPNLTPEMQQEYLNRAMNMMGMSQELESEASRSFM